MIEKVALVGCGAIASTHITAILKSGLKISSLCDVLIERAEMLNDRFALGAKTYKNFYEMLDEGGFSSIHICTPHYLHASMIIAALNKGYNVFTEKPLAISYEEVKSIQKAAKSSVGRVGVCFQNRYLSAVRHAKALVATENIKEAFFSVEWFRDKKYFEEAIWRGIKSESGGGALITQGIHTLDILIWLFGNPKRINAATFNLKQLSQVEDTVAGAIEFDNVLASFFVTTTANSNKPVEITLKGNRELKIIENTIFSQGEPIFSDVYVGGEKSYWGACHEAIIQDFYDCLNNDKPFLLNENEGAKATLATLKIYED